MTPAALFGFLAEKRRRSSGGVLEKEKTKKSHTCPNDGFWTWVGANRCVRMSPSWNDKRRHINCHTRGVREELECRNFHLVVLFKQLLPKNSVRNKPNLT